MIDETAARFLTYHAFHTPGPDAHLMHFQEFFVTRVGQAGLLQVFTEYILIVTVFSFFGMTIFSLATQGSVAPEHRTSSVLTAIICFVAGCSYVVIRTYYHAMLETLIKTNDPGQRHDILYASYLAIGQSATWTGR